MEAWTVSVETPGNDSQRISLGREEITIGRTGCSIELADPLASRRHAVLAHEGGRLILRDLDSRNGTFVNGERTAETAIRPGDEIRIGNSRLIVNGAENAPTETDPPTAEPTRIAIDASRSELLTGDVDPSDARDLLRAKSDLETVYRAGRELSAAESPLRLYDRILDLILREFPAADVCSLHRAGPNGGLQCEAVRRRDPARTGAEHPAFSHSVLHTVNREMKGVLAFDAPTDGRFRENESIQQLHMRSMMGVPLQSRGNRVGILQASTLEPDHRFYRNDLVLLTALGAIAGPVVENALLLDSLRREREALREANRRIQAAQASLIRSEKLSAVGQIAAGIVHDFRNPLTVILSHTELMARILDHGEAAPAELLPSLKEIEKGVTHCNRVAERLLGYAQSDDGEKTRFELERLVRDTVEFLHRKLIAQSIAVSVDAPTESCPVEADGSQIQEVLVNILLNAVEAIGRNGRIDVVVRRDAMEDIEAARVEIRDDGPGMDAETASHIFEPFFTRGKSDPESGGGSGLGLSMCDRIIDQHGGEIRVHTAPGRGTAFEILLPLALGTACADTDIDASDATGP